MALNLGASAANKMYLGSTEINKLLLGSTTVFDGTSGLKTDTYPDLEAFIAEDRPDYDAYTSTHEYDFTSAADLETKLNTALGSIAASENRVTHLYQDGNLFETGWDIDADVYPGAKVVIFGNDGTQYAMDAGEADSSISLHAKGGNADNAGWFDKAEIDQIYYEGSGDPLTYDDAVIVFKTALPAQAAIGKILKVFAPRTTSSTSFWNPEDGAAIWSRHPWQQRIGIHKKIKDINGLEVRVHGPLYDDANNWYHQTAQNATYPLYGMIMAAEPMAVFFEKFRQTGLMQVFNLQTFSLNRVTMRDCLFEQHETLSGTWEGMFSSWGSWEDQLFDTVMRHESEGFMQARYGLMSAQSAARFKWVETGLAGTPPVEFGYSAQGLRHVLDTASASWQLSTGQTDSYYAQAAGPSTEYIAKGITCHKCNAEPFGTHSFAMGGVFEDLKWGDPSSGQAQYALFGGRASRNLWRDFTVNASDAPTNPGNAIIAFDRSGNQNRNCGSWGNVLKRLTINMDVSGRSIMHQGWGGVRGDKHLDVCHIVLDNPSADGYVLDHKHNVGVHLDAGATVDTVYPGLTVNRISASVDINVDDDHGFIRCQDGGDVFFVAPELDFADVGTSSWTGVVGDGACKVFGALYRKDMGGGVSWATQSGGADITDLVIRDGSRPTEKPAVPATFNAASAGSTQINLTWTKGAGNREAGFEIYMSDNASDGFKRIYECGPDVLAYSVTGLVADTTKYFRIYSLNHLGQSASFMSANATTDSGTFSAEFQTVYDRLTVTLGGSLSAGETDALEAFVDGCVTDGIWSKIDDVYVFPLADTTLRERGLKQFSGSGTGSYSFNGDGLKVTKSNGNHYDLGFALGDAGVTNATNVDNFFTVYLTKVENQSTNQRTRIYGTQDVGGNDDSLILTYNDSTNELEPVVGRNATQAWGDGTIDVGTGDLDNVVITTGHLDSDTHLYLDLTLIGTDTLGPFAWPEDYNLWLHTINEAGTPDEWQQEADITYGLFAFGAGQTLSVSNFRTRVRQLMSDLGVTGA